MKLPGSHTVLLAPAVLGLLLPAPEGPYKIQWDSFELVDKTRLDPFNSSHPRRMMVSRFSPVPKTQCAKTCRVPYMSPEVASVEDEIFGEYFGDEVWPYGLLETLELETCCEVAKTHTGGHHLPTLLFGPGLNTTRLFYSSVAQHLASTGYNVVAMDHPYDTDVVQFPDGELIFGGSVGADPDDAANIQFGIDVRSADASFVLDALKIPKTVYIGHSFGGADAISAMLNETRIVSGVNIDGALWGRVVPTGVSRPVLFWGSVGHNSSADSDPSWAEFFEATENKPTDVWARELSVEGSTHRSYFDISVIADVAGLRDGGAIHTFVGNITGERIMDILKPYTADFVEFTLRGGDDGLLAGPDDDYPEVDFLR